MFILLNIFGIPSIKEFKELKCQNIEGCLAITEYYRIKLKIINKTIFKRISIYLNPLTYLQ